MSKNYVEIHSKYKPYLDVITDITTKKEEVYISSEIIAEIIKKEHHEVMNDIKVNLIDRVGKLYQDFNLGEFRPINEPYTKDNTIKHSRDEQYRSNLPKQQALICKALLDVKYKKGEDMIGRDVYLLNENATMILFSKYSLEVRILISSLFMRAIKQLNISSNIRSLDELARFLTPNENNFISMAREEIKENGVITEYFINGILETALSFIPADIEKNMLDNNPWYAEFRKRLKYKPEVNVPKVDLTVDDLDVIGSKK